MTNTQFLNRFDNSSGAAIHQLFWIAGQIESVELKDLLIDDFRVKDWEEAFPDIAMVDIEEYIKSDDVMQLLIDNKKFGFLAELRLPRHSNFTLKKSKPVSWATTYGIATISFVYAETIEQLMKEIEKSADNNFQRCLDKSVKEKQKAVK